MCEIEYVKKHSMRLFDLTFKRYYYGLYSGDIRNIEDLDNKFALEGKIKKGYVSKESRVVNSKIAPMKRRIEEELISYIEKYGDKSGKELETIPKKQILTRKLKTLTI